MPRIRQDNDARYALRASFVDENGDVIQGDTIVIDNSVPTIDFNLVDDLTPQLGGDLDFNGFAAYNVVVNGPATFNDSISVDGYVGVGTTAPTSGNSKVDIRNQGNGAGANIHFENDHNSGFNFGLSGDVYGSIVLWNESNTNMLFATNNAQRMSIANDGVIRGLFTYNGGANPYTTFVSLTQAQYDALGSKDPNTIYFIE